MKIESADPKQLETALQHLAEENQTLRDQLEEQQQSATFTKRLLGITRFPSLTRT